MLFLKRLIYPFLPVPVRVQGRSYLTNAARDLYEGILGRNEADLPPHRLNISGGGSFREIGLHNVHLSQSIAGLQPGDHVLDVGCGIGRTAAAMIPFLSQGGGSYDGIDIIPFAIRWCQRHISARAPNFRFHHANIQNYVYNPRGTFEAGAYKFPFPDASFSFLLATSLFTHLLPDAMANYLHECSRALQPGGTFLSSWFLIDAVNRNLTQVNADFPFRFVHHYQRSTHAPETAVAFDLDFLLSLFQSAGLHIKGIYYGGWSGRAATIDFGQDVIVARKSNA